MGSHPEPGPFQVAAGRSMGDERTLRIFLEIARWADDIRGSEYDHPTWHYLFRPVIDANDPPSKGAPYVTSGNAPEALALRSEEHTSELQSLMRISYAVFCLKKKKK